uniref:Truncated p6 n=1 Tax=Grapevine leafroll-associated virus 3 TaxID=55951 RepID=A0A4D6EA10_9CLOS|nr:truncated p6 [Grapevine leafroll-associated virus 3]
MYSRVFFFKSWVTLPTLV